MSLTPDQKEKYLKNSQLEKYSKGIKKYIDNKYDNLSQEIKNEVEERKLEDFNLESYVQKEIKSKLDEETSIRIESENKIIESVTNLNALVNEKIENEKNVRETSINTLEENLNNSISSLESSLQSSIENEKTTRENEILKVKSDLEKSTKFDNLTIVKNNSGEFILNSSYSKYLDDVLYEKNKPTFTTFNFRNGIKQSYEIGTSVAISGFEHKEENISNINGNLSLRKNSINGTVLKTGISPSTSTEIINYNEVVSSDTSYYLTLVTTKPEIIYKVLSINFYAPAFILTSTANTLNAEQIEGKDSTNIINRIKKDSSSFENTQTVSLTNNGYIYFVTTDNINKMIDFDTGFKFSFNKVNSLVININNIPKVYNVYRSVYLTPDIYNINVYKE